MCDGSGLALLGSAHIWWFVCRVLATSYSLSIPASLPLLAYIFLAPWQRGQWKPHWSDSPSARLISSPGISTGHRESPDHNMEPFSIDLHAPLSKERVEAFSDGVYAIVATLLILDIW